ncbi:MAG: NAD(P)-dependent alcohol dehydrogenase, partial [Anaerolineaceae bacterium]
MKAMVYQEYGPPEVLELKEIEKPTPNDDEVLVRVHASTITPIDWHFLTGTPFVARILAGLFKPRSNVLGADVSGRVEAIGAGVEQFTVGDEVIGGKSSGGYAEFATVQKAELYLKPTKLSFEEAAAVPFSAFGALFCLCELGQLQSGQKVLINGASGGVGTLSIPIAKMLGAQVTAVCSTGSMELVRSLGADQVVDYTQEDIAQSGVSYDLIVDVAAKRSFSDCKRALTPEGLYITTEFTPALAIRGKW